VTPLLRFFRFPVKALLGPYLVATLAAGFGASRLASGAGRRCFLLALGALALAAGGLLFVVRMTPLETQVFLGMDGDLASRALPLVAHSALVCLALCVAGAGLAAAARHAALASPRAAALVAALAIADLARAGAGVNPQVPASFYALLPETRAALQGLGDARVFSYGGQTSPVLGALMDRRTRGIHLQAFHLTRQAETPFTNLLDRVPLAEGFDRHGFIPNRSLIRPSGYDPANVDAILPALRNAAVARIISVDNPQSASLTLRASVPSGVEGVSVQVYDLANPWPRAYVACRALAAADAEAALDPVFSPDFDPARDVVLEGPGRAACGSGRVLERHEVPGDQRYAVELDGDGYFVLRDAYTPSWRASVDGQPAAVLRANGRQRAVSLAAGRHDVRLWYEPPRLRAGLAATALGALLLIALLVRRGAPGR
jgi:hypothetical protein